MIIAKLPHAKFSVTIEDNTNIYTPFLRLKHLDLKFNTSENKYYGTFTRTLKFEHLVRFSQCASKIIHHTTQDKFHFLSTDEMMSLCYLLPTQIIRELINPICALNTRSLDSWDCILTNSPLGFVFSSMVAQYLCYRSDLKVGDIMYGLKSWTPLRWNGTQFVPVASQTLV